MKKIGIAWPQQAGGIGEGRAATLDLVCRRQNFDKNTNEFTALLIFYSCHMVTTCMGRNATGTITPTCRQQFQ